MLRIDPALCSGCRRCEVYCAFWHGKQVSREMARIRVVKLEQFGIDYPVVCQMCMERYCVKCPQNALSIGSLGEITISSELCTGCGICEELCPIGAIELVEGLPVVCDFCGGEPQCVRACNQNAIVFEPTTIEAVCFFEDNKQNGQTTIESRRVKFTLKQTQSMLRSWDSKR